MPGKRYTIFDMMEERGIFALNPANPGARTEQGENLYSGPVEFPKMLYHPKGETRVVDPGEVLETPLGAKVVNVKTEMVSQVVTSTEQEAALRAEGWHDHPGFAVKAATGKAPPMGMQYDVAALEKRIAELQGQIVKQQAIVAAVGEDD